MAKPKKRKVKVRDTNLEVMRAMKCNKVESKKKYKRKVRWHCEECEIESKWGKNG